MLLRRLVLGRDHERRVGRIRRARVREQFDARSCGCIDHHGVLGHPVSQFRTRDEHDAAHPRQGIHDAIGGGDYAARIAKAKGLKKWATCSPDYAGKW